MNSEWVYFGTYCDIATTLWGEQEPVDTVLQGVGSLLISSECKGFTTSVLLQVSCTAMSEVTLKGGDLLTQNCTSVTAAKIWV